MELYKASSRKTSSSWKSFQVQQSDFREVLADKLHRSFEREQTLTELICMLRSLTVILIPLLWPVPLRYADVVSSRVCCGEASRLAAFMALV